MKLQTLHLAEPFHVIEIGDYFQCTRFSKSFLSFFLINILPCCLPACQRQPN
jgi:hypothetical protein